MTEKVAKLFPNGSSQAVRLPAAFRFEGDEVFIRRDEETGEVILSAVPNSWDGFFALREQAGDETRGYLTDRHDAAPQKRELLDAAPPARGKKRR